MKTTKYLTLFIILITSHFGFAQKDSTASSTNNPLYRQVTVEPGIGVHTNFGVDVLLSTLVQWNLYHRLSIATHSSFNINNATQRNFNHVQTDYNYALNQKIGVGTTLYGKKGSHTWLLMGGIKYTSYRETLQNPDFNKVSTSISAFSPDYGLMYSYKRGGKKYFFTYRVYLPLYPWPVKGSDINYIDGNMNNIALEFGIGMKIK